MKYLELFWRCICWSVVWVLILAIPMMTITPDMNVGFIFAVFLSPIFGSVTAIIRFIKKQKIQTLQTKSL
jgi:hypothetical protein